jgi:dTMP kinase
MDSESGLANRTGLFVTFEGPEGGGKTTQARRLVARLESAGRPVLLAREPGGTAVGERIRELVLDPALNPGPLATTEALLFCAARAELVERVIRPALADGVTVVCDRFMDATLAYQGYGGGLDLGGLKRVIGFATGGLEPNRTLLLDLPPAIGLDRRRSDGATNRLDDAELDYHERVRAGYLDLAAHAPERWSIIDASVGSELVATAVWAAVSALRLDADTSALTE